MIALPLRIVAGLLPVLVAVLVRADCECGYTVDSDLYTDLLETDFLELKDISTNTDWAPQQYTVDPGRARGPYGKDASPANVIANPRKSADGSTDEGQRGGDAGLQLIVRGGVPGSGLIPIAEMSTERTDLRYGSFRAGMKLTPVNGTCGAFFWVREARDGMWTVGGATAWSRPVGRGANFRCATAVL